MPVPVPPPSRSGASPPASRTSGPRATPRRGRGSAACMSATGCSRWISPGAAPLAGWPNGPAPRRCPATASPAAPGAGRWRGRTTPGLATRRAPRSTPTRAVPMPRSRGSVRLASCRGNTRFSTSPRGRSRGNRGTAIRCCATTTAGRTASCRRRAPTASVGWRQQQLGGLRRCHRHRPADPDRRPAPRAGNARDVRAGPCGRGALRHRRANGSGRAGFSPCRPQCAGGVVRDPRHGRHPGPLHRALQGRRPALPAQGRVARDRDSRRDPPRARARRARARHNTPHLPRAGHLWRSRRGDAITLASPQLSGGEHSCDCLPRMPRAGRVAELCEATPGWSLIDRNLVAADRDGHIGQRVSARLSCGTPPRGPSRASLTGSDKIHGGRSERPAPGDGIWCWSGHLSLAPVRRRARAAENGSDVASKLGDFGARIARREWSEEIRASPAGGE